MRETHLVTERPEQRARIGRKERRLQVRLLATAVLLEFALFGIAALDLHCVIDSGSRRVIQDSWSWFVADRPTDHPIRQL